MGSTFRRLVAKVASWAVKSEMSALLAPYQLGFGVKGGVEAAIHAARCYLHHLTPGQAVIKLDFKNAFNSVHRDKILGVVLDLAPRIFQFVHSAYSMPSSLFWGDRILHSIEGVQQGDPLGPLPFCLAIHRIQVRLSSELKLLYFDDVTLGGTLEQIERDLRVIEESQDLGLVLNQPKSEVICSDPSSRAPLLSLIPNAKPVAPSAATILGSSVGDMCSIASTITEKTHLLRTMCLHLHHLSAQDALLLLCHSFAIPKLLHILRTSPCFASSSFKSCDLELRSIASTITNVDLEADGPAWSQAFLPVKFGGLGIRSAVQLSSSAFLTSTAASSDLVHQILPFRLHAAPSPYLADAEAEWSHDHDQLPPPTPHKFFRLYLDAGMAV